MKALDGLLLVNKESGLTSHDLVARLRRILNISAVGHCGTLDPIAKGLMVMLVGEATKLSQYILEGNKSYRVQVKLGVRTDTFDRTGKVLEEKPVEVSPTDVVNAASKLAGEFSWPVPIFSAVKVDGQKLYQYARKQESVELPMKVMKFWQVESVLQESPIYEFHLHCSKGSYIRSWVEQLGAAVGCGAMMTELTRTSSHPFSLEKAQTLQQIEQDVAAQKKPECLVPMDQALPHVKKIRVAAVDQTLLRHGQIPQGLRVLLFQNFDVEKDQVIQAVSGETGQILALIGFENGKGFTFRRVFN